MRGVVRVGDHRRVAMHRSALLGRRPGSGRFFTVGNKQEYQSVLARLNIRHLFIAKTAYFFIAH